MRKYFISFSIKGPEYFEFLNEEVEFEGRIMSLNDIAEIEDELKLSLIEHEVIPEENADMYNINILFWKAFGSD